MEGMQEVGPAFLASALATILVVGVSAAADCFCLRAIGIAAAVVLVIVAAAIQWDPSAALRAGLFLSDGWRSARCRRPGRFVLTHVCLLAVLAALLPVRAEAQQAGTVPPSMDDPAPADSAGSPLAQTGEETEEARGTSANLRVPESTTVTRVQESALFDRPQVEVLDLLPASGIGTASGPVGLAGPGAGPWVRALAGPGRLVLTLDGLLLADPATGEPIFEAVPLAAAQRVDLVRGPASGQGAEYGAAGVVDVATEPGGLHRGAAGTLGVGSSGTVFATARLAGDTAWLEAAGTLETRAVAEQWWGDGSDGDRYRGFLRLDLGRDRDLSATVTAGFASWRVAPGGSLLLGGPGTDPAPSDWLSGERDTYHVHATVRWQPVRELVLDATGAWLHSSSDGPTLLEGWPDPGALLDLLPAHQGQRWLAGSSARWQLVEEATLSLGLRYVRDSGTWGSSEAGSLLDIGDDASAWLATPYASAVFEPEGGGVRVIGDLKVDWHSATGAAVSGGVGVAFMPASGTTLRLSTSDGVRHPTLLELSLPGGDALSEERLFQVEAGVEQSFASLGWGRITAFANRVSSPVVPGTPEDPLAGYRNGDEYHTTGLEFEIRLRPLDLLEFRLGYTHAWGDGVGSGALVPAVPANILGFGVLAEVPFDGWSLEGLLELQVVGFEPSSGLSPSNAEPSPPSYATANVGLRARHGLLALFLDVRNLWDAELPAASGATPGGIEAFLGVAVETGDPESWNR